MRYLSEICDCVLMCKELLTKTLALDLSVSTDLCNVYRQQANLM